MEMPGMFDKLLSAKPERQEVSRGVAAGITPQQRDAAVRSLARKGIVRPTAVDIAEEAALLAGTEPAPEAQRGPAPAGRGPYTGATGGNPSPEMLEAVRRLQEQRNRELLERYQAEQRKRSGAR